MTALGYAISLFGIIFLPLLLGLYYANFDRDFSSGPAWYISWTKPLGTTATWVFFIVIIIAIVMSLAGV